MSPAKAPPAPRRTPLTRQRILQTALALVDRHGLDELTMRKLAAELDVEAMSLYKHVANKSDLLAGLGELVWAEIAAAAPPTDDWPAWLRSFGHALRGAVHRHPSALPVLVTGEAILAPALELFADQLERRPPAQRDQAVSAMRTVVAFAFGWAATERTCFGPAPAKSDETERQRVLRISRALPPDTPERLVDTAITVCGDCDAHTVFTDGLELIIRGSQ